MKTLVIRFATADEATQAQSALFAAYPIRHACGSLSNRVSAVTALCVVGGAILGYLAANGTVARWGIMLDGGNSYLGVVTHDPLILLGYSALGLALGIPVGLILGVFATFFPERGVQPFRLATLMHYDQTLIALTTNRHAARIAQLLRDNRAQKVQTLTGRIDPAQVRAALAQLARQST